MATHTAPPPRDHLNNNPALRDVPYLSEELMEGPPSCKAEDLNTPRLRRCPFDLAAVSWNDSVHLGSGIDGCSWKVKFKEGFFVLKLFWHNEAPFPTAYFPVQRECQNAALFQMIEKAKTTGTPHIYRA
ncbi:hypothetical protein F5X99DRAFT_406797 [Biscogniauxia marginata]|nr:hypothetical protein F5X99DRAFT_406797 [Biscogniauxia marginata]